MRLTRKIPVFQPLWDEKERNAVADVLNSDYLNESKTVRKFERAFAEYTKSRFCVAVTSGSTALYVALMALRWNSLNVHIPDFTSIFAAHACKQANCDLTIHDVQMKNGSMKLLEKSMQIVVHANGRLGQVSRGAVSIEDCAQKPNHHSPDHVSCYSFASSKHITTAGQGGAVCCDDPDIFDKLCRIKDHGRNDRQKGLPMSDSYTEFGTNAKMTEVQAAFGLAQLQKLTWRLHVIKSNYRIIKDILRNKKGIEFLRPHPAWYLDILVPDPEKLQTKLLATAQVETRRFSKPLHQQPEFIHHVEDESNFSNTDYLYKHGLYLPSSTNMSENELHYVCDSILTALL